MRAEFKANARLKQELEASRDTGYGMGTQTDCSQEDDLKYHNRAQEASTYLKAQLSLFSGNVALFTHATTAMSLAYGLCDNLHEDVEQWFQEYVTENKPKGVNVNPKDFSEHPGMGPGGIIKISWKGGRCAALYPVNNTALQSTQCEPPSATGFHQNPNALFHYFLLLFTTFSLEITKIKKKKTLVRGGEGNGGREVGGGRLPSE